MLGRAVCEVRGGELWALRQREAARGLRGVPVRGGQQRELGRVRRGVHRVRDPAVEVLGRVLVVRTGGLTLAVYEPAGVAAQAGGGLLRDGRGAAEYGEQDREQNAREPLPAGAAGRRPGGAVGRCVGGGRPACVAYHRSPPCLA